MVFHYNETASLNGFSMYQNIIILLEKIMKKHLKIKRPNNIYIHIYTYIFYVKIC